MLQSTLTSLHDTLGKGIDQWLDFRQRILQHIVIGSGEIVGFGQGKTEEPLSVETIVETKVASAPAEQDRAVLQPVQ
jgi:hypothetical protein